LESTKRGVFKITQRGLEEVNKNPVRIDVNYLLQFPEFVEFRAIRNSGETEMAVDVSHVSDKTPEEILESAYQRMRQELAGELLLAIKSCSPAFFERLVIDLLVSMGYGGSRIDAGSAIGKSGDGGIDGIIKEDRLGLDAIYVQAKRWENPVGRPEVQKFAGALQGHRAKKGVFITTSSYTKEAHEYVSKIDNKIVLMDGAMLSSLMIDNNVGVSPSVSYELKRVDSDYFVEE
jgi:restriction system protein